MTIRRRLVKEYFLTSTVVFLGLPENAEVVGVLESKPQLIVLQDELPTRFQTRCFEIYTSEERIAGKDVSYVGSYVREERRLHIFERKISD
jgi:hypothetical protein